MHHYSRGLQPFFIFIILLLYFLSGGFCDILSLSKFCPVTSLILSQLMTEPILVTGGCGFLGFHIVQALLKDPSIGPVTVVSRNPKANIFDGVSYKAGNIAGMDFVNGVFVSIKPEIIFHTAAPRPTDETVTEDLCQDTNVKGTRNMIQTAKGCDATKYFIFTSIVNVIQGGRTHQCR